MLRPSLASRASHLARVSLNHSYRGKRANSCRNERTVAAAAASGAAIILLLSTRTATTPREPNGDRTQPSRTVQTSSIFTRASIDPELNPQRYLFNVFTRRPIHITRCDDEQGEQDTNDDDNEEEEQLLPLNDNGEDSNDITGYTEAESFYQCLDYHRSLLSDYRRRWGPPDLAAEEDDAEDEGHKQPAQDQPAQDQPTQTANNNNKTSKRNQSSWPRRVPTDDEINALETDLKFCLRLPTNDTDKSVSCHNLQFRVAAYYVAQDDPVAQRRGFKKIKQLAEQGYPDGMCYYGEYQKSDAIV